MTSSNYQSLPIREMTAVQITKSALLELKQWRYVAWRQGNNAAKRRKNTVTPGIPDILGYDRDTGRAMGCEVKTLGDKLSTEQKEFLAALSNAGGLSLVACQKGNAVELVRFDEYVKNKL